MRLLEKIINRINVLDLESLCLIVAQAVWSINTKLVLFNYDGNLIEASSIATIASLMHFRLPDATVTPEGDVIVHSLEEREPVPLTLFHYPICVTFQFMDHTLLKKIISENQEIFPDKHSNRVRKAMQLMICDPTEEEEEFMKNVLVVCGNTYREIVAIQSVGRISLNTFSKRLLNDCTMKAFERVKFVTDYLKQEIEKQKQSASAIATMQRYNHFFYDAMKNCELCIAKDYRRHPIFGKGNNFTLPAADEDLSIKQVSADSSAIDEGVSIFLRSQRSAQAKIGQGGLSKWGIEQNVTIQQEFDNNMEEGDEVEAEIVSVQHTQSAENSYAKILGPRKQMENYWNFPNANPIQAAPSAIPLKPVDDMLISQKGKPQKQNQWVKVENKKAPKAEEQLKKGQKKLLKQKTNAKQSLIPSHLKIPRAISSDEDEVVELKSEYK